jgi:hypothetical protein
VSDDPVWAYCGQRAVDRKTTKGVTRHALTVWARLSGAMDAECGVIGLVEVGPWNPAAWDPDTAPACPRCAAYLAGAVPIPEEHNALAAPDPLGTPSLFEAA